MKPSQRYRQLGKDYQPPKRTKMHQVTTFVRAQTSGNVDAVRLAERLEICRSQADGCYVKKSDGREFCTRCGCPQWTLSELTAKLRKRYVYCPKGLIERA